MKKDFLLTLNFGEDSEDAETYLVSMSDKEAEDLEKHLDDGYSEGELGYTLMDLSKVKVLTPSYIKREILNV